MVIIPLITTGTSLVLLTIICIFAFLIGLPILLVFGIWALGFHLLVPAFPMTNMALVSYEELQSFPYTVIPLFILVGDLVNEAKINEEIIEFSESLVGWMPGSTGNTVVVTSAVFSAITGSNAATTASVGKALYPSLIEEGYEEKHSAATIAAGGTLGVIIPPSILLIIYGVTFNVSITQLFLAGIIPGLLMLVMLVGINTYLSNKNGYGTQKEFNIEFRDVIRKGWQAKIGLGTIVILLGGIFLGFFTPSESAAVAVFYIILTTLFTKKITRLEQVTRAIFNSLLLLGVIVPLVVMSVMIQQNLAYLGLQKIISDSIIALDSRLLIILVMVIIMLISGSVLSSVPNMLLVAPLLAGAASSIGLTPLMWGIVFMISDSLGFITPPYGLNLYIISGITEIDYLKVAYAALPYLAGLILVWVLFFLYPEANILV